MKALSGGCFIIVGRLETYLEILESKEKSWNGIKSRNLHDSGLTFCRIGKQFLL